MDLMNGFNVGMQAGQMSSPVSGVNSMLKNILQRAEKLGLVRAQSQYQNQGAMDLEAFKTKQEQQLVDEYYAANPQMNTGKPRYYTDDSGQSILANVDFSGGRPSTKYSVMNPMSPEEVKAADKIRRAAAAAAAGGANGFELGDQ